MMQLVIGNKNYSSWSMRPWVLMKHHALPFEEVMVRFGADIGPDSPFKRRVLALSPAGRVPLLIDDGHVVWDSLAIAETLAEKFPALALWPRDPAARARARSASAEMHSGFGALRSHFPMNIEAALPEIGPRILSGQPDVQADLDRIVALWDSALQDSGGPWLFGDTFGIADAFYAPVVMRLLTYAVPVPASARAYMARVVDGPGVAAWIREALEERDFVAHDEPYRTSRHSSMNGG